VTRTVINVDDELLVLARQILGTSPKKDTVNVALREIVRLHAVPVVTSPPGPVRAGSIWWTVCERACPSCAAPAGYGCRSASGNRTERPHVGRIRAAGPGAW
jgi:hypothetical protein